MVLSRSSMQCAVATIWKRQHGVRCERRDVAGEDGDEERGDDPTHLAPPLGRADQRKGADIVSLRPTSRANPADQLQGCVRRRGARLADRKYPVAWSVGL